MGDSEVVHRAPGHVTPEEAKDLADLVDAVADEFVPSLRHRSSTTDQVLTGRAGGDVSGYVNEMLAQDNLLVYESGTLVAFMSFKAKHSVPALSHLGEFIYVSTIAVRPDRRRSGYARRLYEELFSLPGDPAEWVVVRTWSTNDAHVPLLHQLGFRLLLTQEDHRGAGVHTLYFGRPRGGPVEGTAADLATR